MIFETEKLGDLTVVHIKGSVLSEDNKLFSENLSGFLNAGSTRVIIDGSEMEYINSQAIGDLMLFYNSFKANGGQLAMAQLSPVVDKVIRSVGLAMLVGVYDSVEEARHAMG